MTTPADGASVGRAFAGRYYLIEELGEGGMGRVFLAQDKELEERVAIKVIKPKIAADEKILQRFRNELKLARKINHKNICRVFDLNKFGDTPYITMEYVRGENLKSLMKRAGPLSVGKTVTIAGQISAGLDEAHRLGVIHRDLKPQNIMIDQEGNVRIMDFGIARILTASGLTDDGQMIGTLEYMSPEQLEGKKADERSDIYSVGVMMYEMLIGRLPFEGDTPVSIAAKHITAVPVEPHALNSQIPAPVSRTIMKCLEKESGRRYASAGELLAELRTIEKEISGTRPVRTLTGSWTTKSIRRPAALKRYALPALVLAGCFLVWFFALRRPSPEKPSAFTSVTSAQEQPQKKSAAADVDKVPEKKIEEKTNILKPAPAGGFTPTENKAEEKPNVVKAAPKEAPKAVEPAPPEKPKIDLDGLMKEGREAYQKGDYDRCLQAMAAVLKVVPGEAAARSLQADAAEKKKAQLAEQDIKARVENVIRLFQTEDYEKCLSEAKAVLAAVPTQAEATKYAGLAALKLAPGQINALVQDFVRAFSEGALPAFYRDRASPDLAGKVEKDVALITAAYSAFRAAASNIEVRVADNDRAETSFIVTASAERKSDGRREILFEGTYLWQLEKRGDRWMIVAITARPAEKKQP